MITPEKRSLPNIFIILPILALSVDLFTPFLIWKNVLPAEIRWLSHLTIALMILLTILQMFSVNHIPRSLWALLAVVIVWSYVALGYGQGIPSTVWGVWLLFQFPLLSLFAYLQPNPPGGLPANIQKYALILLGLEVVVQLLQYASGQLPGDDLAGLFAKNGTGIAVIFAIMVICLFLGYWIAGKHWLGIPATLILGSISSSLGEVKLFPFAVSIVGFCAILIYGVKYKSLGGVLVNLVLVVAIALGFVSFYNLVVPVARRVPFQTYLMNPAALSEYLNRAESSYTSGGRYVTDIGRGYAISVGWNSIKKDPITLLFGYGFGARSESRTLGTAGVGLTKGDLGLSVGTSLLILMQETGVIGLTVLGCLILWIIFTLARDIGALPAVPTNGIRYALILISIMWPAMLWYANVWAMRVPMLIYWYLLGYVLAESQTLKSHTQSSALKLSVQVG